MRKIKKLIAVILATMIMMSVASFSMSASAATAPEFSVTLVSENASTAVIRFTMLKGAFNSLDFTLYTSSAFTACTNIEQTDEFKTKGCMAMTNPATKMVSIAGTNVVDKATSIVDFTLTKKSANPIKNTDIGVVVENCVITVSDPVMGNKNIDLTDDVKVTIDLKSFQLNDAAVNMDYKSSYTISYETNYAANELTWTSSNEDVVSVDENGKLTTNGTGNATITVTSADGRVNETCEVSVKYTWWQWIIVIVLFGWIWY